MLLGMVHRGVWCARGGWDGAPTRTCMRILGVRNCALAGLRRSLPKGMGYQTFKQILDYLEASNKIICKDDRIVWVAADTPKLRELFERSVKLR